MADSENFIELTDDQKQAFSVRIKLTAAQREQIKDSHGLDAEELVVGTRGTEDIGLIVKPSDLVYW